MLLIRNLFVMGGVKLGYILPALSTIVDSKNRQLIAGFIIQNLGRSNPIPNAYESAKDVYPTPRSGAQHSSPYHSSLSQ
jgi:hypothetical protein